MRILIASDNYPPFIGGAHRQTQLLARELQKRGHAVSVATVWHGGLPEHEQDEAGVSVYRLKQLATSVPPLVKPGVQQHQPPFPDPVTVRELNRLIPQVKPDLIHSYGWFSYSVAVALRNKNIPLLISARDYAYSCATRTLVYRGQELCSGPALRKCLGCAAHLYGAPKGWVAAAGVAAFKPLLKSKTNGVHNVSSYVGEITARDFFGFEESHAGASASPIEAVIPSFQADAASGERTDPSELSSVLESLPDQPFILFVGALRRVKGVEQLLQVYSRLDAPPPLVLAGTIESDSPREFPPGVTVVQNLSHRAVMAVWERSLFGVLPSLWPEPFGSVVYEGMSRGKAVIGTIPGGHADMIVNRVSGLLVPLGDVDALERAMRELITDADLREQLGSAARERAKLFSADVAVPRFERLYREIIAAHHAPRAGPPIYQTFEVSDSAL